MDFFTVVGVYPAGPNGANRAHAVRQNLHTREEVDRAIDHMIQNMDIKVYWVFEGASLISSESVATRTAAQNNRKFA